MKGLNPSTVAGIDYLSGKFLKDGADVLAPPIYQLCNISIKLNSFPRSCKIAKVKPVFEEGSKTDPLNYHPISLVTLLSNIIERIVHDQTEESLNNNKVLHRFKSGFWKTTRHTFQWNDFNWFSKSLWQHWTTNFTKENQIFRLSKNTVTWFKSYLCERKFKIIINSSYSCPANLLCGVPLESISSPLLFLLDINDLPPAVVSDLLLYSDDTYIIFQHKSKIEIEKQLIRDFSSVCVLFVTTN